MSKPLPLPTLFAGLAPPWSLSQLDSNTSEVFAALNDIGTYNTLLLDVGAPNVMLVTPPAGLTLTPTLGLSFFVIPANTNSSTAPTINVGTGAITITDLTGAPLFPGALQQGGVYQLVFNGPTFAVLNPTHGNRSGVAFKSALTSRISTNTPANDPDLVITIPGAGLFSIFLFVTYYATVSANMGLVANLNYSGSYTAGSSFIWPVNALGGGIPITAAEIIAAQNGFISLMGVGGGLSTTASTPNSIQVWGSILTTTSGTLGFSWSQAAPTANPLNVLAGSYLTVNRLG